LPVAERIFSAAAAPAAASRAVVTTRSPAAARRRAISKPMPRLLPVTMAVGCAGAAVAIAAEAEAAAALRPGGDDVGRGRAAREARAPRRAGRARADCMRRRP